MQIHGVLPVNPDCRKVDLLTLRLVAAGISTARCALTECMDIAFPGILNRR